MCCPGDRCPSGRRRSSPICSPPFPWSAIRSPPGCSAAIRSIIRRSTASSRCTICCRSFSWRSSALHVWALHVTGQNNPTGVEVKDVEKETVPFTPYATLKDAFGIGVFLVLYAWLTFFVPNYLGHPDNYIEANPLVTPAHIVPEWYFLPFYAILRAIPNKLLGVIALFSAMIIPAALPWLDLSKVKSARYRPLVRQGLLGLRRGRRRPWLSWRAAGGRRSSDRRAGADSLLFLPLPRASAAARPSLKRPGQSRRRSPRRSRRRMPLSRMRPMRDAAMQVAYA